MARLVLALGIALLVANIVVYAMGTLGHVYVRKGRVFFTSPAPPT